MLKAILCVGLFALCVAIALLLTKKYRHRKDFFYNWNLFNERLLNEVSYTKTPLPAFVEKYSFNGDFRQILEDKKRRGFDASHIECAYLTKDEQKLLSDYFMMVGKSDAVSQRTYLSAVRGEIGDRRRASEEVYQKYFSLYIKLGVLAGLILVILVL